MEFHDGASSWINTQSINRVTICNSTSAALPSSDFVRDAHASRQNISYLHFRMPRGSELAESSTQSANSRLHELASTGANLEKTPVL